MTFSSDSFKSFSFSFSIRIPYLSCIISVGPSVFVDITGLPSAIASIMHSPNPSHLEFNTKM